MKLSIQCLTLFAVASAAFAANIPQNFQKQDDFSAPSAKEDVHARMQVLVQQIENLRARGNSAHQIEPLEKELHALSASLGGDLPARRLAPGQTMPPPAPQALVAPPVCSGSATTASFSGTTGPIAPPTTPIATFTTTVSGVGAYLWDVNLTTFITHTACADLDITLTSPAGTIVTITTDNGGTLDNVFNGTVWNDNVNDTAADRVYTNLVTATPLTPEGSITAFRGQNPNGTWTLTVIDDTTTNTGTVNSWSLDVSTLASAPVESTTNFNQSPNLAILDVMTVSDTLAVSGVGTYMDKLVLTVQITHTFAADLDITLTSPTGTVVTVTTDNGGGNDNVFNGTVFTPSSTDPVTDHVYANLVVATPLSPEGSFDNFLGQNPNGNWILTITDDLGGDFGNLARWDLDVTTTTAPSPAGPVNFAGTTGPIPDFGTPTPVSSVFTALVSGVGASLWDVDLNTFITHTSAADIDMTLTSPAGTTVIITTDNGGTNDNVFNGTLWDDNANDGVVDHIYTNLVTATPLSPEGRIANFRGENPNGTWTLTIIDDATADNGTLNSWSLDVSTVPASPGEVSSTTSNTPNLAIPDVMTVSDVMAISGAGSQLIEVELYMEITHTFAADLDITLTSPSGTVVQVTTDNGGANDNVFNGTLFDSDSTDPVTEHVFANLVVVPLLSPEGSFDNFRGQNPNGNWTLTITDDLGGDVGNLARWDLTIRTCGNNYPGFCFGDDSGTHCPCSTTPPTGGTIPPGAPGNGCPNSLFPGGAHLAAAGNATVGVSDTLVLLGSDMPNSSALYFQGNAQAGAGGAGAVFGDGLRCATTGVIRLKTVVNVGNASQYPEAGDLSVSAKGLVSAGNTKYYQCWYRNSALFCVANSTFNLTNGVTVLWN